MQDILASYPLQGVRLSNIVCNHRASVIEPSFRNGGYRDPCGTNRSFEDTGTSVRIQQALTLRILYDCRVLRQKQNLATDVSYYTS